MKTVSLLYHDAVIKGNIAESGFSGPAASVYKLDVGDMKKHFTAVAESRHVKPSSIHAHLGNRGQTQIPFFLTFDDGGISAATHIADLLGEFGWIGHFFITANCIDKPSFVNSVQIRELTRKGHVVGSHSWSHPDRMSKCSWHELVDEWTKSVTRLSEITGEKVCVASVPGGYFSKEVAMSASACGIRALFTSEPVKRAYYVDNCLVLGRYAIFRGMSPAVSRAFSSETLSIQQLIQYLFWNAKKVTKSIAGKHYTVLRERVLRTSVVRHK